MGEARSQDVRGVELFSSRSRFKVSYYVFPSIGLLASASYLRLRFALGGVSREELSSAKEAYG